MSETLRRVRLLVQRGELQVSQHGFRELTADDILLDDLVAGIESAVVIEDYPDFFRGPSVLVLQRDMQGRPIHVVWGIPKKSMTPAVLVTAYRPDPTRWSDDMTKRGRQ
jgi:hypothetical protein